MARTKKSQNADSSEIDMTFIGSREESAESRTIASRKRLRSQLDDDIAKFLQGGGEINEVDAHVMTDPPRRPDGNYGGRPI